MQFFWISGISSTFSPTAVLSSNHIERKEAANTLFFRKTSPTLPLPLIEHADVCLSLAGGPKICNLFLELARFAINCHTFTFPGNRKPLESRDQSQFVLAQGKQVFFFSSHL